MITNIIIIMASKGLSSKSDLETQNEEESEREDYEWNISQLYQLKF